MFDTYNVSNATLTESLEQLNARYADALMPLTITFGGFAVFGIAGNALVLLVVIFGRKFKRDNFTTFVITLGIIDFITCMALIPAEIIKHRHYFDFSDVVSCKVKCFFNVFGACASCFALLVISIERFYQVVVQPMKPPISSRVVICSMFVGAFVIPIALTVPGTIMCGIDKANKTNLYGGQTEVFLCSASDKYRDTKWQKTYKICLSVLLVGMCLTYIALYTLVMREAIKQVRFMTAQRKMTSSNVPLSSTMSQSCDDQRKNKHLVKTQEHEGARNETSLMHHQNSSCSLHESRKKRLATQFTSSLRSIRGHLPEIHRDQFPSKTFVWFILTITFVITYSLYNYIALDFGTVSLEMSPDRFVVRCLLYRIYFFNHIVNPFVYAILVKRFRQSCRSLIPTIIKCLSDCK